MVGPKQATDTKKAANIKQVIVHGHAKLTLHLKVEKKLRSDGYHNVQILSIPLDLSNTITIKKSIWGTSVKTNTEDIPNGKGSLVWKAAQLMTDSFSNEIMPVKIKVEENIPISSGLGGGSADAAAVLKGMNELFNLNLPLEWLASRGIELGSDVPLCVHDRPAIVMEKGDVITPIELFIDNDILLVTPLLREKVNKTGIVYKTFDQHSADMPEIADVKDVLVYGRSDYYSPNFSKLGNCFAGLPIEFLNTSFGLIRDFKGKPGIVHAGLAGAGPTVYFILEKNSESVVYAIRTSLMDSEAQIILTRQHRPKCE